MVTYHTLLLTRMEINGSKKLKPSETMLRTLFEVFGPIRAVDIPMLDPYRTKMVINPQNTFAFGQDGFFEAFVQYQEYAGFLNCMTAFRGMKLLFKDGNTAWSSIIQVISIKIQFMRIQLPNSNLLRFHRSILIEPGI